MRKTIAAVAAGLALSMTVAAPASAANGDSACESSEMCLYWGANLTGAAWTHSALAIHNFASFTFRCCGLGSGQSLNDNTVSGRSRNSVFDVDLATAAFGQGTYITVDPGQRINNFGEYNNSFSSWY